ncbi:MAG: hypothetical protein IT285_10035, partial [Bdellovibrionales bacterium]|nr:hypothetical protein [Bdellovibrionales bacterium]
MPRSRPELSAEDALRDAWESLGVAFAENQSGVRDADPERILILSLPEFREDRKLLKLVMAWLIEYGDLLHVERLRSLARELPVESLTWLGGLANHQAYGSGSKGDRRWLALLNFIKERIGPIKKQVPASRLDELQAKRVGADKGFGSFGILVPRLEPADPKKIRSRQAVLQENLWLRMRALMGSNWRADVASVMVLGVAKTS